MSIYRGSGGSGDATSDATINEVTELVQDANEYKDEAATSASNAATSASNAATSESNASTSETNASSSASGAATSETNAGTSATNAATSATSASTSASNASTSATAAQTAQTAAEAAKASAETAETNASASATSATNSASTATTQAGIATTKASEASTSATNAATSETNAGNSASSASTSASNAATSETNAATSATNAGTSETNAAASATSASSSASSATSSASSAAGSATTATTKASEAATSASNAATSESNASTSETNAASSATSASSSASSATTSATNAATSATNASTSATNAANSATAAAASAVTAASFTPSQTGNAGKFLTTDGSVTSWDNVAGGDLVDDTTPQLGGDLDLNSNDITGTGNISLAGTSTVTPSITLTTTEDSSDAAPIIELKRNSASPADGDYLGQLKFVGENDADQEVIYAKITGKTSDVTDGTEDGLIEFAVKENGSNTIVARITKDSVNLINSTDLEVDGTVTATSFSGDGTSLTGVAPLNSPTFTGTPLSTTPAAADNSTKIATTAFVNGEFSSRQAASSGFTLTAGGLLTWAHGLGSAPVIVNGYIKCVTAQHGWSVGDEIQVNIHNNTTATASRINSVYHDATNVYVRISSNSSAFFISNKTTGAAASITNNRWELYIRAFV